MFDFEIQFIKYILSTWIVKFGKSGFGLSAFPSVGLASMNNDMKSFSQEC